MMLGIRDVFQYLECKACGCIQLVDPPHDMERYYPPNYIAFGSRERRTLPPLQRVRHYFRKRRNAGFLKSQKWVDRFLTSRYDYPQLKGFARIGANQEARILDVGCGSGALLADLKELGYRNLLGIDRFAPQSTCGRGDVKVLKGSLQDIIGTMWDVIMFHHSFEHMPDPVGLLQLTMGLLAPGGHCLIRIPVVGWAWQHYGVNWAQLDAPRHLFLHTEKSLRLLADAVGLRVKEVTYDSNEIQFWVSELYAREGTLASVGWVPPRNIFSKSKLLEFRSRAAQLNLERLGDSAVFQLTKS
jgi:SAM-dependent methyltransferase